MMKVTLPVSESVTPLRNNVDNTFLAYLIKLGHEWLYSREAVGAARSDGFADNASSLQTLIASQIHLGSELLSGKLDTSPVCIGWVPVWWLNRNDSSSLLTAAPSWMEGICNHPTATEPGWDCARVPQRTMSWFRAMLGWSWRKRQLAAHVLAGWVHWTISYCCWKWVQLSISTWHGLVHQGKRVLEKHAFKTHSCWWYPGLTAAITKRNTIRSHWWRCRRLWAGTVASPSWSASPGVTAWEMSPGTSRLALRECFLPNTFLPCVLTQWMFLQIISAFLIKSYQTQTHNFLLGNLNPLSNSL